MSSDSFEKNPTHLRTLPTHFKSKLALIYTNIIVNKEKSVNAGIRFFHCNMLSVPYWEKLTYKYFEGNFHGLRYSGIAIRLAALSPMISSFTGSNFMDRPSFIDSTLKLTATSILT